MSVLTIKKSEPFDSNEKILVRAWKKLAPAHFVLRDGPDIHTDNIDHGHAPPG
jgi:hypothetical protein